MNSRTRMLAVMCGAVACLATGVLAAPAQAGKAVTGVIGAPASEGAGRLFRPAGIAVNLSGAGGVSAGDVYVSDSANNRIEEFSATGEFVRAFGYDVVESGEDNTGENETQEVTVDASGGSFTLAITKHTNAAYTKGSNVITNVIAPTSAFHVGDAVVGLVPAGTTITAVGSDSLTLSADATRTFPITQFHATETTAPIPFDATGAELEAALATLPAIGAGNVAVSGGPGASAPLTVEYTGALGHSYVMHSKQSSGDDGSSIEAISSALSGAGHTATIATTALGGGYEVCSASSSPTDVCKSAPHCTRGSSAPEACKRVSGAGSLSEPSGIAIDQATGNVYVAEMAGTSDTTNSRVDVYSATGGFEGAFGWHVDASSPEEKLQFCTTASGCQHGTLGSGAGQLNWPATRRSLPAIDPTDGHLYLGAGNNRLEEFAPALNGSGEVTGASFVRALGWDVVESGPDDVPPVNAVQKLTIPASVTAGSFTLSFENPLTHEKATTNPIPFNVSRNALNTTLDGVASIGNGNIDVSSLGGGEFELVFQGFLEDVPVPLFAVDSGKLSGGTATIAELSAGVSPYEICDVAVHSADVCKLGKPGGHPGQFGEGLGTVSPQGPASVAVDSSGAVFAASEDFDKSPLSLETRTNVQRFDPSGAPVEEFAPIQLTATSGGVGNTKNDTSVAIDPVSDHVLVTKKIDTERFQILEFDGSGNLLDTSGGEAGLKGGSFPPPAVAVGLGERLYVLTGEAQGLESQLKILAPPPPPAVTPPTVTGVGATSATFHGTVTLPPPGSEGEGFQTSYHFEYSSDGANWSRVPAKEVDIGDGSGAGSPESCPTDNPPSCNVSQTATGLEASAEYEARLVASDGNTATSTAVPFTTEAAPPSISETVAEEVDQSSAELSGLINPNNDATTYHFEWGTDSGYGTRIPAEAEASAGSGGKAVKVSAAVSGLTAGSVYHFRILASNSTGTTEGPDQEFIALDSSGLPDNRVPEMVSPADKRPQGSVGTLLNLQSYAQARSDGSALAFPILLGLGDTTAGGDVRYLATRGEAGWQSTQVTPPALTPASVAEGDFPGLVASYSADLSCALVISRQPLSADTPALDTELEVANLYRWNRKDGTYTLISNRVPLNPGEINFNLAGFFKIAGTSPDCSRIYFQSAYDFFEGACDLYEWDDGSLRDAGLLPDGAPGKNTAFGSQFGKGTLMNAVSEDGSRLFFTATSDQGADKGKAAVMVRKAGGAEVSDASQSKTATASLGAHYETASPDGSHVFFVANYGIAATSSKGPVEAGCDAAERIPYNNTACDLYDYDVETGQLTDLSADANPADAKGAVAEGVLDVSKDGSYAYFAAMGQLIPGRGRTYGENLSGSKSANVYLSHEGALSYVATLEGNDFNNGIFLRVVANEGSALIRNSAVWTARSTPDGKHLVFASLADITGYRSPGKKQEYLYSADSGKTVCVSCPRDGGPSQGSVFGGPLPWASLEAGYHPRWVSEDGRRVFFSSKDVLAPGALAGTSNLYEWQQGQVYLLVAGEDGEEPPVSGTEYLDMSNSGDDVFVVTKRQLDPRDVDFAYDAYDLKVGGGFPYEAPKAPCDPAADQCQGSPTAPPPAPAGPGSAGFSGPGNPPPGKHHKKHHRKKTHKHKAHKRRQSRTANSNHGGAK